MRSINLNPVGYLAICFALLAASVVDAESLPDRFVWVFGWNLQSDSDVEQMTDVLETAAKHGVNGAVMSLGLDSLSKRSPDYLRRLEQIELVCKRNQLEIIPAIFSVGYGGTALSEDRNLAEGMPVIDAPFVVRDNVAQLVADPELGLANAGFEQYKGNRFSGWQFHDDPGQVSFVDTEVKHSGNASLRLENFASNPHGHGRVMQEVKLHPNRCYRLSVWVKTEALMPIDNFMVQVLADDHPISPRKFDLSSTDDWQKLTMVFNSLNHPSVRVYAGMWGGESGELWVDD